jgi:hypothetical protein
VKPAKKADVIRAVLRDAPRPLTLRELLPKMEQRIRQVVGRKALYAQLGMMQTAGEIRAEGRGDDRRYSLTGGKG